VDRAADFESACGGSTPPGAMRTAGVLETRMNTRNRRSKTRQWGHSYRWAAAGTRMNTRMGAGARGRARRCVPRCDPGNSKAGDTVDVTAGSFCGAGRMREWSVTAEGGGDDLAEAARGLVGIGLVLCRNQVGCGPRPPVCANGTCDQQLQVPFVVQHLRRRGLMPRVGSRGRAPRSRTTHRPQATACRVRLPRRRAAGRTRG
jgi:hypothetical protein